MFAPATGSPSTSSATVWHTTGGSGVGGGAAGHSYSSTYERRPSPKSTTTQKRRLDDDDDDDRDEDHPMERSPVPEMQQGGQGGTGQQSRRMAGRLIPKRVRTGDDGNGDDLGNGRNKSGKDGSNKQSVDDVDVGLLLGM